MKPELKPIVAELRHLYTILVTTGVPDPRGLAQGLLAPQIEKLERIAHD